MTPATLSPVALPRAIEGLAALAANWRWTWDPLARAVLSDLSPPTWGRTRESAVRTLREAPREDVERRAADPAYVARVERAALALRADLARAPWRGAGLDPTSPVAYVCAEFGIHATLPVYSGGLGVLAGDHLRAASDLALPLVAVGVLYRDGYLRQRLVGGVEQAADPERWEPTDAALAPVLSSDGAPVEVSVPLAGLVLRLRAWKADVGRVPLYLLDADHDGNPAELRGITKTLYAAAPGLRLRQEVVLGRGAVRLLARLGIAPAVWHVNEGHGALVALERVVDAVEAGRSFEDACAAVRRTTAFTTHTPVPAGHDRFDEASARRDLGDVAGRLGVPWSRVFALGEAASTPGEFNMTGLALRFARFVGAVSERHRQVSVDLLRGFTTHPEDPVKVEGVTNGVHLSTWAEDGLSRLLGAVDRPVVAADYARAAALEPRALWAVRTEARRRLLDAVRTQIAWGIGPAAAAPSRVARLHEGLDERALWIGFARRFAAYKRADLLFRDVGRLRALVDRPGMPVRIVIAGKAHPADERARELLARLARLAAGEGLAGRVYLLEGYDLALARALVQGVDVWLNTPRAPLEACGTSGMKAAACGALNLSVADGWWPEAADGRNGWTIGEGAAGGAPAGTGSMPADEDAQDAADAASLYRLLEDEVVPLFFRRDASDGPSDVPAAWLERVRHSLATIPPVFDAVRMVGQYRDLAYAPPSTSRDNRARSVSQG